jgi:hypothetical protein
MTDVLLPHVQVRRNAARLLLVDTRWAIEQGDLERATRNIEAMLGISSQVAEGKFLVCSFVGYAINGMPLEVIDECLNSEAKLTDQHLERIHHAISKVRIEQMIDIASERAMFMDVIQKTYTDNGQGDGRITAAGLNLMKKSMGMRASQFNNAQESSVEYVVRHAVAPTSMLFMPTRKQLTDKANELFARVDNLLKSPTDAAALASFEGEINELPTSYQMLKGLFPAISMARHATIRSQVNAESMSAALAVIRYQRQHGHLLKSLEELVGKYLERIPADPFADQPLRYLPQADNFVIYSVGVNRVDDGGQQVLIRADGSFVEDVSQEQFVGELRPLPAGNYLWQNEYPGDWVLWPRHSDQE